MNHTITIRGAIFREYDIRGNVETELSVEFAHLLGRAYASLAAENCKNNIIIGYDCRLSSASYAAALAEGMADEGISALLTGMGPTPQAYFALYASAFKHYHIGGCIQVTGSHNPPDMNGFKLCLGQRTLLGADIQDLRRRCEKFLHDPSSVAKPGVSKRGTITTLDTRPAYIQDLTENVRPFIGSRKLKVVVDAGNGVGGLVGPEILRGLGVEVIELFCDPDGHFPNHHPDPTVIENLTALIEKVKETKADFGIGWDGDADRIGVVDEKGQIIFGDLLVLLFARAILSKLPHATIIGDVKCSSILFDEVTQRGGNAIMWKTGHSLIKAKLKETGGQLAGEMSGHICFADRFYGFDDALYCSARLIELMSKEPRPLSTLLVDVPHMYSTPEIRVPCSDELKFRIPEAAKKSFAQYKLSTIDGVRIEFPEGWALIRASNTQSILVLRFEAKSQAKLSEYQEIVRGEIERIKTLLSPA